MADSWEDDDCEHVLNLNVAPVVAASNNDDDSDGGNWDDDDFEAPVVAVAANDDEDEVDLVHEDLKKVSGATGAPSKVAEAQLRKQAAEEAAILYQVQAGGLKGETAEQKKIRERKQQEESDLVQALDAFGGFTVKKEPEKATADVFTSLTKGIGAVILKSKLDHTNFGKSTYIKLSHSDPEHLVAFYKELSNILTQTGFTLAILDQIVDDFSNAKTALAAKERSAGIVPQPRNSKTAAAEVATKAVVNDDDLDDCWGGDDDDYLPAAKSAAPAQKVDVLLEQHANYGTALCLKLARSTPLNIVAFYKGLNSLLSDVNWTSLDLGDIVAPLTVIYAARSEVEKKLPKVKTAKETKQAKIDKEMRAKELYGDSNYSDRFDEYTSIEDDY
jgi:hypothetical protein